MKHGAPLIALAAAGLGLWAYSRRSAAVESADDEAGQGTASAFEAFTTFNPYAQFQDMMTKTDEDQAAANVAAFLAMIRKAEGTAGPNGYRMMFGGRLFDSFEDHPRRAQQFTTQDGRRLWTSAAGAYQFMAVSPIPGTDKSTAVNTWDVLAAQLGLPDFSPASQDAAAVELIRQNGALGDVRAGRFEEAVRKVRKTWASMPGAGYAQPEKSLDALRVAYLDAGGTLA